MKRCPKCETAKPLTDYGLNGTRADGSRTPDSYCRECRARLTRERRAKQRSTPEGLAKNRADAARWKRTYYKNHREHMLAARRRYYEQVKADAERYARYLESCRMNAALRRERQGLPPRGVRPLEARSTPKVPRVRLPVEPFVTWLLKFPNPQLVTNGDDAFTRRVYAYLHGESKHVDLPVADAMLVANGFHLRDVYTPDEFPWLYESVGS